MQKIAKAEREIFLEKYIQNAPLGLALMRALQCSMLSRPEYRRPVLDLGCGEGLFASILFKDYVDIGVDINVSEIYSAQKTGVYQHVIAADGGHIPLADGCVGTVYSNCVLEHLPDIEKVFTEVRRVLRKDGEFIFTAADKSFSKLLFFPALLDIMGCRSISTWYAGLYDKVFKHYQRLNHEEWIRMLEGAGFKVLDSQVYFPPRAVQIYDLLLPLSIFAFINKRFLGRWVISPSLRRRLLTGFGKRLLDNYYHMESKTGGEIFIRAIKV